MQRPKFPPLVRTSGGHPVLFSAYGSHGLWSAPGEHNFVRVPQLTDKNGYGVPWKTWDSLDIYYLGTSKLPRWLNFKGHWGNPKSNCVLFSKLGICELTDGPVGILTRKQDFYCWNVSWTLFGGISSFCCKLFCYFIFMNKNGNHHLPSLTL